LRLLIRKNLLICLLQTLQKILIIIWNKFFKIYIAVLNILINILDILSFLLLFILLMRMMKLCWALSLKSLYAFKIHIIIICLNISLQLYWIIIWWVIMKNAFKSLTTSTLTLKWFIWNLIYNILIELKIVKYMLSLKTLWLIVISPFLFSVC
jgi:hypothetical protein